MRTPEGKLKDEVKKLLAERGVWYRMIVTAGFGRPLLDFLLCYKGHMGVIETKAPGDVPRGRQLETMEDLRQAGAFVIWGDDIEIIQMKLDGWITAVELDHGRR